MKEATWHFHGVFWAPEGTERVITSADGGSVLYVDRVSTGAPW